MKKLVFSLLMVIIAIGANAQTNFRNLTYKDALATAQTEGKLVFIDFYTTWCGPCKAMARDIFPQAKVGAYMNETFVCIQLDAEKEGKAQADQYKVDAYPTMIITNAKGEEIYRKVGGSTDADEFVAELKVGSNPSLTPEKMRKRYNEGDRSAELVNALANTLYRQATETRRKDTALLAESRKMVEDYFNALTDAQRLQEENFFVYSYNFVENPKQIQAQYLFNNINRFPASMNENVKTTVDRLLRYRMGLLLQGVDQYGQEDIDIVADAIKKTGIGKKDEFVPTLAVLSALLQGDEKYFSAIEKNYDKMNLSDQINIAESIGNNIKSTDPAFCAKVNKWLRSKLPTMNYSVIYYAATSIRSLEKRINPTRKMSIKQ